jgi:iron complex transport system substrate-binding protein
VAAHRGGRKPADTKEKEFPVRTRSTLARVTTTIIGLALAIANLLVLPATRAAAAPVTIENCGVTTAYAQAPRRVVTLNQHATEVMLALGLVDRMVGTAYLDDEILPSLRDAYRRVPVIADRYPSKEVLLASEPDFVYGGFASAFRSPNMYTRDELLASGATTYLTGAACLGEQALTLDTVYADILNIGRIFGVEARAQAVVAEMRARVDETVGRIQSAGAFGSTRVMIYDSDTEAPYVAACCGAGGMAITASGGRNVFDDLTGGWKATNWEAVVDRNPEVIVLIEAEWSSAREKARFLLDNEALATVDAIRNVRMVTVPFTSTTPGVRNPDLVRQLAIAIYPELFR